MTDVNLSQASLGECTAAIEAEREAYHIQQSYPVAYGRCQPAGTVMPMLRLRASQSHPGTLTAEAPSKPAQ